MGGAPSRLAVVAATAACLLVASARGAPAPVVHVTPALSLEDQTVDIRVTGLSPHERVTVTVDSTDSKGYPWHSYALLTADEHGVVDMGRRASVSGTYAGAAWRLGLIASMTPTRNDPIGVYYWDGTKPLVFTVTVDARGVAVAHATFRRAWTSVPLVVRDESVAADRFFGVYLAPESARHRPAVLVFGGSDGGLGPYLLAARLAADGVPALVLAYFREPGLPPNLKDIPLEYFRGALSWLGRQPQVAARHMAVLGISRGSEAALLLGAHYPQLVHGVIALDGSGGGCIGAAWTVAGRPLPYATDYTHPPAAAAIPVERIRAPVLLACGALDAIWPSCPFSRAIESRLRLKHHPRAQLFAYPQAGHTIGVLLPDEPGVASRDPNTPQDEIAREHLYPHVLAFLRGLGG